MTVLKSHSEVDMPLYILRGVNPLSMCIKCLTATSFSCLEHEEPSLTLPQKASHKLSCTLGNISSTSAQNKKQLNYPLVQSFPI